VSRNVEIVCAACGAETLLRREPKYDGFKKVGETLRCAACGHAYANEEAVPFKMHKAARLFGEEDRFRKVDVFEGDEKGRNCRHCRHYLVNPFTQRCGRRFKEVQATDVCPDFERKDVAPGPAESGGNPDDPNPREGHG
jgi:DNA-directed RNA polymerase subunit RPC12/RpoP